MTVGARDKSRPSLAVIRRWPATVNVGQAAEALGVSRASLYAALARGEQPVATITVGRRLVVLTHSLIAVLEGDGNRAASA
jgi:hypothetical protein